jgi:hypothetical protein
MNVALALGLGLAAGAVGTVVLTVSETVEQRLTQRKTSTVPGRRGLVGQGRRRGGRGTVEHTGALDPRHHLGRRPGSFGTDRPGDGGGDRGALRGSVGRRCAALPDPGQSPTDTTGSVRSGIPNGRRSSCLPVIATDRLDEQKLTVLCLRALQTPWSTSTRSWCKTSPRTAGPSD